MSGPLGSSQWMYNSSTGFYSTTIDQSLRLNNSDNPYLKFDITSDGNRKTFTLSFWFKIGRFDSSNHRQIYTDGNTSSYSYISLSTADQLYFQLNDGASSKVIYTNRLFRDVSAWYHAVIAVDTTQVTDTDRVKMYINGEQETYASASYPVKDNDTTINKNGNDHYIGKYAGNNSRNFGGYLAEMHFVSGSQLAPTSFGETSNGTWIPKQYTGSYGTNGFHLDFSTSSFTDNGSDPDVFADQAGSNDFNAYNLAASDIVLDSPTNNFATFNTLINFSATTDPVFSEGNLKTRPESDGISYKYTGVGSTINVSSGKWYAEFKPTATSGSTNAYIIGIIEQGLDRMTSNSAGSTWDGGYIYGGSGTIQGNGNVKTASWGDTFTTNDVIGVALDMDNGKLWFSKNGVFQASGDPAAGTNAAFTTLKTYNDTYAFSVGCGQTSSQYHEYEGNFGQNPSFNGTFTGGDVGTQTDGNGIGLFKYAPPSGFLALCTSNLPEPTIGPNSTTQNDDNFNTVLYTGDGSTSHAITGVGFQPDMVWIKRRNYANPHFLNDSVRGATKDLQPDDTDTETTNNIYGILKSFDSDGFTVSVGSTNGARANTSGGTFVGWSWKAGGTAVSNGDGSIASSVSANQDAGFSIVTWTGNGTDGATVGHGLTSPELSIVKNRDATTNWDVCWVDFSSGTSLNLDTNVAEFSPTQGYQTLGSSTITLNSGGSGVTRVNTNNQDYVAYVFKSVEGFSKVGSYIGNNSANGTFVYTGFRPAWIMLKEYDGTASWYIFDTARDPENDGTSTNLQANSDAIEGTSTPGFDILSNGFKLRLTSGAVNGLNDNYIYLAFAEQPFKYANAR